MSIFNHSFKDLLSGRRDNVREVHKTLAASGTSKVNQNYEYLLFGKNEINFTVINKKSVIF